MAAGLSVKQRPIRVNARAAIVQDSSILLVEYFNPEWGTYYALPGGGTIRLSKWPCG